MILDRKSVCPQHTHTQPTEGVVHQNVRPLVHSPVQVARAVGTKGLDVAPLSLSECAGIR